MSLSAELIESNHNHIDNLILIGFHCSMRLITSYAEMNSYPITGCKSYLSCAVFLNWLPALIHRLVLQELFGSILPGYLGASNEDSTSSFDAILQHIIETDPK